MQWLIDIVLENFKGMILMWHGAIVDIPSGWHLCDGTLGTPDLRDIFIYGAGGGSSPGDTGGSWFHTHVFTGDGHSHLLPAGADIAAGSDFDKDTSSVPAQGTTQQAAIVPPYYAICFIMKL